MDFAGGEVWWTSRGDGPEGWRSDLVTVRRGPDPGDPRAAAVERTDRAGSLTEFAYAIADGAGAGHLGPEQPRQPGHHLRRRRGVADPREGGPRRLALTARRPAPLGSLRDQPDHAQPAVGGLREPADLHRDHPERGRAARGRDGLPLRPEPDDRVAGDGGDPTHHRQGPRSAPDDLRPGPVGADLRRAGCGLGHLPRRGRGRTRPPGA